MMQPNGKHVRPQNTSSVFKVSTVSKIAATVHTLYRHLVAGGWGGGPCIYGTYVIPHVAEGLTNICFIQCYYGGKIYNFEIFIILILMHKVRNSQNGTVKCGFLSDLNDYDIDLHAQS